jgi:RNA 3'-terminal phosphate cyclase (ATP)
VLRATVEPCAQLQRCVFDTRGELISLEATALLSALSASIGRRELQVLGDRLKLDEPALRLENVRPAVGPGNALLVRVHHANHTETFTGHGERGVLAEQVALRLADEVQGYLQSTASVGEHLADQLLLPMALAGGGEFTTPAISDHLSSNARLIEKFLPVEIAWEQIVPDCWKVTVAA